MKICKDIKLSIRKNMLKKIIKWLFSTLIIVLFILFFNSSFDVTTSNVKFFVYTTFLLIPFFVFKIPSLLVDHSWKGIIINIFTEEVVESSHKAVPNLPTLGKQIIVYAEVLLDNGSSKIIKLYCGDYNNRTNNIIDRYEKGNTVIHIKGASFYQVISKHGVSCVICGCFNNSNKECKQCGHTLNVNIGEK